MLSDCENKTINFLKKQRNRVSSIEEFLKLKDKMVWLVTVPSDNTSKIYANSMISEWHVDDCYNEYGEKITSKSDFELPIYTPHKTKFKLHNGIKYRYMLSLTDYNVIDHSENNTSHAIFYDKESAEMYRVWLLMTFDKADIYNLIDDRIVNCTLVEWDNFIKFGLQYSGTTI